MTNVNRTDPYHDARRGAEVVHAAGGLCDQSVRLGGRVSRPRRPGLDDLRRQGPALGREPCRRIPMYLPGTKPNDKVLILEDANDDGKADRCTTFADGLHVPIGIELGDGGVYLSQMPNLMFLKDTDGDDRADTRELIMHGFDTADSHHAMHAFTWDPGGALTGRRGRSTTRTDGNAVRAARGATRRASFAGSRRPGSLTCSSRTASPIPGAITSTAGDRTSWPTHPAGPTISARPSPGRWSIPRSTAA